MTATGRRDEGSALPASLRRMAAVAMVLASLLFVTLAFRYSGDSEPGRLDLRTEQIVDSAAQGVGPLRALVLVGDPLPVIVLASALAGLALALGRRRLAVLAILGPGLTGLATTSLKPAVGRLLSGDFAYPSGHTGAATALGIVTALLVVDLLRVGRAWGAVLLAAGAVLAGGLMAVGLTVHDWHYPTDTVGGFCVAVVVVLGTALLLDHLVDRRGHQGAS